MSDDCEHQGFEVIARVHRLTDGDGGKVTNYMLEAEVICSSCRQPFHFVGAEPGLSMRRPMGSVDGLELRAPIAPGEAPTPTGPIRFDVGSLGRAKD